MNIEIMATLWPEMPHWKFFAADKRLTGIRLNTAMADPKTLPGLVKQAVDTSFDTPIYFDVKGRQLRINHVDPRTDHLEIDINHRISVETPTTVIFKSGMDSAVLLEVKDGRRLIFEGGPNYNLIPGESLNIRHPSLKVHGPVFTEKQMQFLEIALENNIDKFMLSFTRSMEELDELRTIVGPKAEVIGKIEEEQGVNFVKEEFVQKVGFLFPKTQRPENTGLLCARGDLFVEVNKPHDILKATEEIIKADPNAILGSRILLSVTDERVPSCADLSELAWLMDIGYKRFMFCDGLCLKKDALDRAICILEAVAETRN